MKRLGLRRTLTVTLALGASLPTLIGVSSASAASVGQSVPSGIDRSQPTVVGSLVAKAVPGARPAASVVCGARDRTPEAKC